MSEIAKIVEDGARRIGKSLGEDAGQAVKKLYHQTGDNLERVTKNHLENDAEHASKLKSLANRESREHAPKTPHEGGGPGGKPGSSGAGGHSGGPGGPGGSGGEKPKLDGIGPARKQVGNARQAGRNDNAVCAGGEPVDMATGRMFMDEVDASLPGTLPLEFTRSHESGYQAGRWMGLRWVCTFDERLEADQDGVVHLGADRVAQLFPCPAPGEAPVYASAGARTELRLEADGGRYTLTDPAAGLVREFTPQPGSSTALLTRIRDRSGRTIDFGYDELGRPHALTHSGGYRLLVTVEQDRITALHLAGAGEDGRDALLRRYAYTDGHLSAVYDGEGRAMGFVNDAEGRILSWTDRAGTEYRYTYDTLGRVIEEGAADGTLRFRFGYGEPDPETGERVHTETDALGHTTTYRINAYSQITAVTDPLGATTQHTWDDYDRPLSVTDPLGRTTAYAYDGAGDVVRLTRADGEEVHAAYGDRPGLLTELVQPGGAVWRVSHDAAGRRTALTDPLGATTRYRYDERGNLAAVTDPLGRTTTVRCDAAGLPVEVRDPLGATTRYLRDAFGRVVAVTDPLGAVTRLGWTPHGRLASRTTPDGATETWTYDAEGNLLSHTDPAGRTTTHEYGLFGTLLATTDPDGARYTFTHDAALRLTTVTDALGRTWDYTYDEAGRLVRESDFHGRTVEYRYDAAGRLTARRNALGQEVRYHYDALGQVTVKEADGRTTEFGYDPAGNLVRAADPATELLRTLDPAGNLLSETVDGRTLTHTLDGLGRRIRRTTPGGHTSSWTYDEAGRRSALETPDGQVRFDYDAAGRELRRTVDDRLALASGWDDRDRLVTQELTAGPRALQRRDYTYREDGHLVAVDDLLAGHRRFELDAAGQVTAVRAGRTAGPRAEEWQESYAYDPAGNLTEARWPATDATEAALGEREFTEHRLTGAGRVRYEYDAAGRVTLRQVTRLSRKPDTWHYTWDSEDRLTAVTTPDGARWRYRYDPFGRRTAKERLADDGETVVERTLFTWDGATLAEQTTEAPYLPGRHTLSWDHQGLQPIAQTETLVPAGAEAAADDEAEVSRRFFAIVTDLIGTPLELVDAATESVAWRASASLWGNTSWPSTSSTYTPLRFPGQYFDPETRLHYNLARYYDPETARYTSPDPLGLEAAPNAETYVRNPHTVCDPLGLYCVYRSLRPDEDPADGLIAKDPSAEKTLTQHVVAGSKPGFKSQYISTTKSLAVIERWKPKDGTARVVKIDLSKYPGKVYDLTTERGRAAAPGRDAANHFPHKGFAANYAKSSKEVVLLGRVPPEAISWVEGGPAT